MKLLTSIIKLIIFLIIFNVIVQNNSAQTVSTQRLSKLDQSIQSGFDSLKTRKWSEAETNFEAADKIFEKEKQPSELLFDLIDIPDEDKSNPPTSSTEKQITGYRHTVATKQALLQFLSFTYQLDGKTAQAQKYHKAVYNLQGPLWGTSWRVFAPLFYKLFDTYVPGETGENAGHYQYLAANLLLDSGESLTTIFDLLQNAQKNLPKDAAVAALLANGFLQKRNPVEAKKQAELSLSIKPGVKSVLIDLATAEWLLEDFDNSVKHSEEAIKLDAEAPGPRMTLALNYIGKNDLPRALKEASRAVDLSRRHPFYLTVQAAVFEVSGNEKEAEKLLREAWKQGLPTFDDLDKWYINKQLREIVLKIVRRIDQIKGDT